MNVQPANQMKTGAPMSPVSESERQMNERVKVLNQMLERKVKKIETPQSYKDALAETRVKKNEKQRQ